LLIYDYSLSPTIGRIRFATEIVVPVADQKSEAPYSIELFWQIKVIRFVINITNYLIFTDIILLQRNGYKKTTP